MKKKLRTLLPIIVACALCLALAGLTGCDGSSGSNSKSNKEQASSEQITINQSPDKYTWYVKNYVGMNLANAGYISLGEDLRDSYGAANIKLIPISVDGSYVDVSNEEALKDYVVIDQNLNPNTEIKLEFELDENGDEYENLVSCSSSDDLVLLVKKTTGPSNAQFDIPLTEISQSPDAELRYTKDYIGRNLAAAGYISMAGDLRDTYGKGSIKLSPVADDGSFIDTDDIESLKQYRVVSQSIEPNTKLSFTFDPEYDNIVRSQNVQTIELKVTKVA